MSISEKIMATLAELGIPVSDGLYQGKEKEYIYFVIADDRAGDFGDSMALADQYSVQIHYCCPWSKPYSATKSQIRHILENAGFTYPEVIDMSDPDNRIRRLVFECDIDSDDL